MLTLKKAVTKNAQMMSGEIVFSGTRVPVWMLFDHIRHGHPLNEFFEGYPGVTREQVEAVLDSSLAEIRKAFAGSRAA